MAHGTIKIDTVKSSTAGLAPVFVDSADREIIQGCTARLKFNGSGTPAIDDSFNVSSITDHSTGQWTVNFAVAMTNADYSFVGSTNYVSWWGGLDLYSAAGMTTSSCRIVSHRAGTYSDTTENCCAFFGGL